MQNPKPGMSTKRDVVFHPRWGTVHELWPDGTTRCGNGHTIPVVAYVRMKADDTARRADAREADLP